MNDYADYVKMLSALLCLQYTVHEAVSANQAIRMARRRAYHLYLLDYHMPDISGQDVCRTTRAFDPHTPILALSADDVAKKALEAGASAFLCKAADPDRLIQVVGSLIARQTLYDDGARAAEEAAIAEEARARMARQHQVDSRMHAKVECFRHEVREARQALDDIRQLPGGLPELHGAGWRTRRIPRALAASEGDGRWPMSGVSVQGQAHPSRMRDVTARQQRATSKQSRFTALQAPAL